MYMLTAPTLRIKTKVDSGFDASAIELSALELAETLSDVTIQ